MVIMNRTRIIGASANGVIRYISIASANGVLGLATFIGARRYIKIVKVVKPGVLFTKPDKLP